MNALVRYRNGRLNHLARSISVVRLAVVLAACTVMSSISLQSQVLNPPVLQCANNLISGDVELNWSIPSNPCGPFQGYEIYAANDPAGPYTLLTTITNELTTSWVHVGASGAFTDWYYYIVPDYDCPGFSTVTSDTLDNRDPEAPSLDYVTVVPGGVEIRWFPSPSPEAWAYIIYRQSMGFTPIDTVYGRLNTFYFHATPDIDSTQISYSIAALDSCLALGLFANPVHNTIFLEAALDPCGDLNLSWNGYGTWDDGVQDQEIWTSVNGAPLSLNTSVGASATSATIPVNDGDQVCVRIRAFRSDGIISESNEVCVDIEKIQPAQFAYLRNLTMVGNDSAEISWHLDPAAGLDEWRLEQSGDGSGFSPLSVNPIPPVLPPFQTYLHGSGPAGTFYRVQSEDSCGVTERSEIGRTIRLQANPGFQLQTELTWNAPGIMNATIQNYNLYRLEGGSWVLLSSLGPGTLNYTDDVSNYPSNDQAICYRVEAEFELNIIELGLSENLVSVSNEICVEQPARIFTPNAIVPNGINNIFKPVILFADEASYEMSIYGRNGAEIFRTQDINAGWDGTFNGQAVPGGAYAFLIRFRDTDGREFVEKGHVLVVY